MTETGRIAQGYMSAKHLRNGMTPQRVQGLVIRNYAQKNHFTLPFISAESRLPDNYQVLAELYQNQVRHKSDSILVFYSIEQFPREHKVGLLLAESVRQEKLELHFSLEDIAAKNSSQLDLILFTSWVGEIAGLPEGFSLND